VGAAPVDGDVEPARLGRVPSAQGPQRGALPSLVATQLLAQGFIRRRSRARWLAHQLVFWGCILAGLITFPLTMGLLHFESVGQQGDRYQVYVSRVGTLKFDADSMLGWTIFHGLDIAAVLVLAGVFIFLRRRLRDPGALAVERSGDFLALAGLFAVSVTGLFLTVSSIWLEGRFYSALNTIHALTVILGLMYLPFGKLFHIFQRPGNLGVAYYKRRTPRARRCGVPAVWRRLRQRAADRRPAKRSSPGRVRLRSTADGRRQLPGHVPEVPPRLSHVGADRRVWEGSADGTHTDHRCRADRTLRAAPQPGAARWMERGLEIDKVVDTHCCFCGQQCGIKLKVHDNEVVGFEPWYDFPFNEGKLCPKGVKRYLQGSHPDRVLVPDGTRRDRPGRVPRVSWDHALDRVVSEIRRIQDDLRRRRVRDVVGCVADEREELPDRQVRPPRVAHREPRLQRPLLHGVGRCRQQEGARDRPGIEPVERHPARRRGVDRRHQRRRDVPDHHELHLESPRPRRPPDRAGPARRAARPHRGPVPAGPPGTIRRCSGRCCTS
jgi:hypothetical protein